MLATRHWLVINSCPLDSVGHVNISGFLVFGWESSLNGDDLTVTVPWLSSRIIGVWLKGLLVVHQTLLLGSVISVLNRNHVSYWLVSYLYSCCGISVGKLHLSIESAVMYWHWTELTEPFNGDVTGLSTRNISVSANLNFDVRTALLAYYRSHKMKVVTQTGSPTSGDCGLSLVHKCQTVSSTDAEAKPDL